MKTYCTAVASPPLQLYKDTLNKALDYLKPQSGHRRSAGMPSVDGPLQLVQQAVVHEGGIFTVSIKDGSPLPRLTTHMYFNALRSMAMFRSGYSYAGRESWCKRSGLWSRASSMTWIHTSGQRRPFQPVRHHTKHHAAAVATRASMWSRHIGRDIYKEEGSVRYNLCRSRGSGSSKHTLQPLSSHHHH